MLCLVPGTHWDLIQLYRVWGARYHLYQSRATRTHWTMRLQYLILSYRIPLYRLATFQPNCLVPDTGYSLASDTT